MDWVSRSVRQKASVLEKTYRQLEGSLGRSASEEEVAAALELTLPQLHALLSEVGQMSLFSLEDLGVDAGQDRWQIEKLLDENGTDPMQALLSRRRADRGRGHGAAGEGTDGNRALLPRGITMRPAPCSADRVAVSQLRAKHCSACARCCTALRRSQQTRGGMMEQ
jgi:hypothetical protein